MALACVTAPAHAIQTCELDGQHVNPANGHTTAGKSGLMRCKDADTGVLQREQELRDGRFVGLVRYYRDGVLEREHRVNERGNRDGVARTYAASPKGPVLVHEETLRNGTTIGLTRRWHPGGALARVAFHDDDGREQAVAAFNEAGQLTELRCAALPRLAPAADDAAWCGHSGQPATVTLFSSRGVPQEKRVYERGDWRQREAFWDNGTRREVAEQTAQGGAERQYGPQGVLRRETLWEWANPSASGTRRRVTTLEREFHETGPRQRERQWTVTERGAELRREQQWFLNGQPRELHEYLSEGGRPFRQDTLFHDNGQRRHEGRWLLSGRYERLPQGVHRSFDPNGRLRGESHHDERGRLVREREWDAGGALVRDDELFEDGSRKAFSR